MQFFLFNYLLLDLPCAAYKYKSFFGVVSIAQSVEVTDSAVLGGVAEVVSSNPSWAIKIFFSISRHS